MHGRNDTLGKHIDSMTGTGLNVLYPGYPNSAVSTRQATPAEKARDARAVADKMARQKTDNTFTLRGRLAMRPQDAQPREKAADIQPVSSIAQLETSDAPPVTSNVIPGSWIANIAELAATLELERISINVYAKGKVTITSK